MQVRFFFKISFLILTFLAPSFEVLAHDCGSYACQEGLVKFSRRASVQEIENTFNVLGIRPLKYFEKTRLYHVQFSGEHDTLNEIKTLGTQENVLLASANGKITADLLANDPYFSYEWGLKNSSGSTLADIGIEDMWNYFTDASSTVVAVIDTGVDYAHPDLAANMWTNTAEIAANGIDDDANGYIDDVYGYDFANGDANPMDDHYHGTHVAGTIGAVGNNGIGISGVAWQAKIMSLKFMNSSGSGWYSDAVEAIEYAINNGAKVLNNSWGSTFNDSTLETVVNASNSAGVIFVAAAGNDGEDNDLFPHYPSNYSGANLVSVASMNEEDELSSFSNYGAISVDIAAPGESILSTLPSWYYAGSEDYAYLSGTSMAAPHVAGAAALLWSAFPSKTHLQIIDLLYQGGVSKSYLSSKVLTGKIINVSQSLFIANNSYDHAPLANAGSTQYKMLGDVVTFQALVSDEDAGAQLSYAWTLSSPAGSLSTLSSSSVLNPSFIPDIEGTYQATLIASDGILESTPSVVQIVVSPLDQTPPTVSIELFQETGSEQSTLNESSQVELGSTVTLDASSSTDNNASDLDYEWSISAKPAGSTAVLENADEVIATLVPDKAGTYHMTLTIDDGRNESTGTVTVVVTESIVSGQQTEEDSAGQGSDTAAAAAGSAGGCSLSQTSSASLIPYNLFVLLGVYGLRKKKLSK